MATRMPFLASAMMAVAASVSPVPAHALQLGGLFSPGSPVPAQAENNQPADPVTDGSLGILPDLIGKRFQSPGGSVVFDVAKDGRYRATIEGLYIFLVRRGADGKPEVKFQSPGTVKIEGTLEPGTNGLNFGIPRWNKHFHLIFDASGNIDYVMTTDKPDGLRLDTYAKLLDLSNVAAMRAGAGVMPLGKGRNAEAERVLGIKLTELSSLLNRGSPPVAMAANRPTPVVPATRPAAAMSPEPALAAIPSGPRIALVIGNATYGTGLGSLANPLNDAREVTRALRASGFTVINVSNADQKTMKRAIQEFGRQLSNAGGNATGLFYYAGHGVQSRGVNYLVPVGASIASEGDIDIEAVAADSVVRQMEDAGASTTIVILDACRNLPVARMLRDGTRGLARMDAPNGSFVAYSTAPGSVAQDGAGANSPFATALVAEMMKPGQLIETTFRNVRRKVLETTGGKQTPWDSSSLTESFTFVNAK